MDLTIVFIFDVFNVAVPVVLVLNDIVPKVDGDLTIVALRLDFGMRVKGGRK